MDVEIPEESLDQESLGECIMMDADAPPDITIVCGSQEFRAHKCFLSVRLVF